MNDSDHGLIDGTGKVLIPVKAGQSIGDGRDGELIISANGTSVIYDRNIQPISAPLQGDIFLVDSYARKGDKAVCKSTYDSSKGHNVYTYSGGAFPKQFGDILPFSDGLAAVRDLKSGKWGFINEEGEIVIPCQFFDDEMDYEDGGGAEFYFNGGLVVVHRDDSSQILIDKQGNRIFEGISWGFPLNGKGYIGLGEYPSVTYWEYDPVTKAKKRISENEMNTKNVIYRGLISGSGGPYAAFDWDTNICTYYDRDGKKVLTLPKGCRGLDFNGNYTIMTDKTGKMHIINRQGVIVKRNVAPYSPLNVG